MSGETQEVVPETIEPGDLAERQIHEKNRWLIHLRWIFAGAILVTWGLERIFPKAGSTPRNDLLLIIALVLGCNAMLLWWIRRPAGESESGYRRLYQLVSLQLDFDLAALALVVYLSHSTRDYTWVFFVFHIVVSSFFLVFEKALRNTLAIIFLVTLISLLHNGLTPESSHIMVLVFKILLILLAFFLAYGTASHSFRKEKLFQDLLEKSRVLSITDGLTHLYNQTYFFSRLSLQLEESRLKDRPFSLIIFDVDNFKNYNDCNGHIKGSMALQNMGRIMKTAFRKSDILAKYGGDEFVVILPGTDKVGAYLAAERLREKVEKAKFTGGESQPQGRVTVSVGIASYPEHGDTEDIILDRADRAMYVSKETGRNRTTIYASELEDLDLESY